MNPTKILSSFYIPCWLHTQCKAFRLDGTLVEVCRVEIDSSRSLQCCEIFSLNLTANHHGYSPVFFPLETDHFITVARQRTAIVNVMVQSEILTFTLNSIRVILLANDDFIYQDTLADLSLDNSVACSPQANYTDQTAAACWRS
jgi:hypothetical protein